VRQWELCYDGLKVHAAHEKRGRKCTCPRSQRLCCARSRSFCLGVVLTLTTVCFATKQNAKKPGIAVRKWATGFTRKTDALDRMKWPFVIDLLHSVASMIRGHIFGHLTEHAGLSLIHVFTSLRGGKKTRHVHGTVAQRMSQALTLRTIPCACDCTRMVRRLRHHTGRFFERFFIAGADCQSGFSPRLPHHRNLETPSATSTHIHCSARFALLLCGLERASGATVKVLLRWFEGSHAT